MIQVTLEGLRTISDIKNRLNAYMQLFDVPSFNRSNIQATIKGTFTDECNTLTFLTLAEYRIDTSLLFHKYLTVKVGSEWIRLKPTEEPFTLTLKLKATV